MRSPSLLQDPVLFDAADARALSGMSGAKVVLMTRDASQWFVRKAARAAADSPRLRRQLEKQQAFGSSRDGAMRVPRVLGEGEIDGRFYVDMEYIRGVDGVSYLRRASYSDVVVFADRLCAYLDEMVTRPASQPAPMTLFDALYSKVCDVHRKTSELDGNTLAQLFLGLEVLRDLTAGLQPSMCHGDLTLENLVIDEQGTFWLIDFLDAPFEHWWQDVTKLHQDLEGGWYQRSHPPVARCVLDYLSRRLIAAATEHSTSYAKIHSVLLACTFVRILPYARTADEVAFVRARIDHFARLSSTEMKRL